MIFGEDLFPSGIISRYMNNLPVRHCLSWCQEETSLPKVFEFEARAIDPMRQGTKPENYIDLPHGTRTPSDRAALSRTGYPD